MAKSSGSTRSIRGANSEAKTILRNTEYPISNKFALLKEKNEVNDDMRKRINKMLSRLSNLKGDELNRSNWRKIYQQEAKEKVKELNRKGEAAKDEAEMRMFLQTNFAARDVYNIIDNELRKSK